MPELQAMSCVEGHLTGKATIRPFQRLRWNGGVICMTVLIPEAVYAIGVLKVTGGVDTTVHVFFVLSHIQKKLQIQPFELFGKFRVETRGVLVICTLY